MDALQRSGQRPAHRRLALAGRAALVLVSAACIGQAPARAEEAQPSSMQEVYGDWSVNCGLTGAEGAKTRVCQMSQELRRKETNQLVLAIGISPGDDKVGAKTTVIAPFGLTLADGLRIELDEAELMKGSFATCVPAGCVVEIPLSNDVIKSLASGKTATAVTTIKASGEPMRTDFSLNGFATAWNRLLDLTKQ